MDVTSLITLTLINLNEDTDAETKAEYREQILAYLNQAYSEVMRTRYPVFTTEEINVPSCGVFDTEELTYPIVEVVWVKRNGVPLDWSFCGKEIETAAGDAQLKYRYLPELLALDADKPAFPSDLHYALADYAAYRVLSTGSRTRQLRGEVFYNSYLVALQKLEQRATRRIINKY